MGTSGSTTLPWVPQVEGVSFSASFFEPNPLLPSRPLRRGSGSALPDSHPFGNRLSGNPRKPCPERLRKNATRPHAVTAWSVLEDEHINGWWMMGENGVFELLVMVIDHDHQQGG